MSSILLIIGGGGSVIGLLPPVRMTMIPTPQPISSTDDNAIFRIAFTINFEWHDVSKNPLCPKSQKCA